MRINELQLKQHLTDSYQYHFLKAKELHEADEVTTIQQAYDLGRHDGAMNMVGAILLLCFGGKETFDIWQLVRSWAEDNKNE